MTNEDAKKLARRPKKKNIHLDNISDIRRHFHRDERPIFFISATNFNLLGIDEWCRNFKYITYIDCFDGRHPNVFVPTEVEHPEFESIEDINAYLLEHKEVVDLLKSCTQKPVVVFLMFDARVEKICKELGVDVWFPKAALREKIDDKIETVRIGNAANVPSVPNVLGKIDCWEQLQKLAEPVGTDLVLQSAFGDSGHMHLTIYFAPVKGQIRYIIGCCAIQFLANLLITLQSAGPGCIHLTKQDLRIGDHQFCCDLPRPKHIGGLAQGTDLVLEFFVLQRHVTNQQPTRIGALQQ